MLEKSLQELRLMPFDSAGGTDKEIHRKLSKYK